MVNCLKWSRWSDLSRFFSQLYRDEKSRIPPALKQNDYSGGKPTTYSPDILSKFFWSPRADLNRRPTPYHGVALPTELPGQILKNFEKEISRILEN